MSDHATSPAANDLRNSYNRRMTPPLLTSKLRIPLARDRRVARPELIERLNVALGARHKLSLITAPAGYGKTTLARDWAMASGRPVAWLSLDEADDDPGRLIAYLIASLQTLVAGIGEGVLGTLQSGQAGPPERLLAPLLNELALLDDDILLVLDDTHVLASAAVHAILVFLVEHLPTTVHLVLVARADPALPIARLRVRSEVTELRAVDLRFSVTESASFLTDVMGLTLTAGDITALETRTEGWVAGLQLAALSLQGKSDVAAGVRAFTGAHAFVLDYLLEDVLRKLPAHVQSFLLDTAILERLTGPLCDALRPEAEGSGAETLEHLERVNAFVVPLDDERRWYRYHHLFQDLLRQRLARTLAPADIARLHRRAAVWFEAQGFVGEAFAHALAGDDLDRAADLAEQTWERMDRSFQSAIWLNWAQRLPENALARRPVVCTQMAWAYLDAGDAASSDAWLRQAEHCLADPQAAPRYAEAGQFATLPARIAIARAFNAQSRNALAEAASYAERALRLSPADDPVLRGQATTLLGGTQWANGDLEPAAGAMADWVASARQAGVWGFAVAGASGLADVLIAQGRLSQAQITYRTALEAVAVAGSDVEGVLAHLHLGLGLLHLERAEDDTAANELQRAFALGARSTLVDWAYRRSLAEARLHEADGDWVAVLSRLEEAGGLYVRNPIPDARPVAAQLARVALRSGDLARAQAWARASGLTLDDAPTFLREFEHLTLVRLVIAENAIRRVPGALTAALALLDRLLTAAVAQRRVASQIEIHITRALAQNARGDRATALAALDAALTMAEPEGYRRIFTSEGEPLTALLTEVVAGRTVSGHNAYRAGFLVEPRSPVRRAQAPGFDLSEPLSERELDVLRLVAQGLSNHEISQKLFLALSTVKGHNLRAFGKLGSRNRTEAVARARQLGLL